MAFCTQCGNRLLPTDRFCTQCGARSPESGDARTAPAADASGVRSLRRIEKQRFEHLASVLDRVCQQGIITQAKYGELHASFLAYDDHGTAWTFGIRSRTWHRGQGEYWVPGTPPAQLSVPPEVLDELAALESSPPQKPGVSAPIAAPRAHPAATLPASSAAIPPPRTEISSPPSARGVLAAVGILAVLAFILYQVNANRSSLSPREKFRSINNSFPVFQPSNPPPAAPPAENISSEPSNGQEFQLGDPQGQKEFQEYLLKELERQIPTAEELQGEFKH